MKIIAILEADLDTTPLGTRSRLTTELSGVPVLRRTVQRITAARHILDVVVLCPPSQTEACKTLLAGTNAKVQPIDAPPPPWRALVRTSRKWSLDGWRGGVGGSTHFDEYTNAALMYALQTTMPADAYLCVPPAAAVVDPHLIDAMALHHQKTSGESLMTFTQACPGVAGILLSRSLVQELAEKTIPLGWAFAYKPDAPQKDLIFQAGCCDIPASLRYAKGRLVADTQRATQRIDALLRDHENPDGATIGEWLTEYEKRTIEPFPQEIEIELTIDTPYPDDLLHPTGRRERHRRQIDLETIRKIAVEAGEYDDVLVVLGGLGDPLRHPDFIEILRAIKNVEAGGGAFGLAIRTAAVDLNDENIDAMIEHQVDILNVPLDAWSDDLYARLHSPSNPPQAQLETVRSRLNRVVERQQSRNVPFPIIVPELTKAIDNVGELDDFHDGWLRKLGAVSINGFSHRAGQVEDRSVVRMAPSPRVACHRLRSRCVVLCDGRVAVCDQDIDGLQTVGQIPEQSLKEIWLGEKLAGVRTAHDRMEFENNPLCAACEEWHRP